MSVRQQVVQHVHEVSTDQATWDGIFWSLTPRGIRVGRCVPASNDEANWHLDLAMVEIRDASDEAKQAVYANITALLQPGKGVMYLVANHLQHYGSFALVTYPGGLAIPYGVGWVIRKGAVVAGDRVWLSLIYRTDRM